jgi:hypothetical protein
LIKSEHCNSLNIATVTAALLTYSISIHNVLSDDGWGCLCQWFNGWVDCPNGRKFGFDFMRWEWDTYSSDLWAWGIIGGNDVMADWWQEYADVATMIWCNRSKSE